MHLVLLSHLQLVVVENVEHLLCEILLQIVLYESFFKRCAPLSSVHLLPLQHFVELLLAAGQEQLSEVHFSVVWVVKFLEKLHAKADVCVQVLGLCRALHEDDLDELLQEGRVVVELVQQLSLDFIKILPRDFVQEKAKSAHLVSELIVSLFLSAVEHTDIQLDLALFVGQDQQGHVVGA